jgi:hypothetical protein
MMKLERIAQLKDTAELFASTDKNIVLKKIEANYLGELMLELLEYNVTFNSTIH